ncbi:MAG: hypothetical protein IKO61_12300 [Lachnospiraceae bacterium]|nr:hypothetical protein [Lachnospiraceae bacterium]
MNNKMLHNLTKRLIAMFVAVCFVLCIIPCGFTPLAARNKGGKQLNLVTAMKLAVANSEKIEAIDMQIEAKKAAKQSAIKSLNAKKKNMSTLRWSPLLNFKLPTKPNEQEAFEFQFKPTQIQSEIDKLEHKKQAQKIEEYAAVRSYFVDIVSCENIITFNTERLESLDDAKKKLSAKLKLGQAQQGDIDKVEAKIGELETKISNATSKQLRAEKKLSTAIGIDVTSGYTFENPFVSSEIGRSAVKYLENYAVDHDQGYYEAKMDADMEMLSLQINYNLIKNKYGGKVNSIASFVTQAMNGGNINKKAFKKAYDEFLTKIDDPWRGNYKILFFKFPKERLKGDNDGTNWIEDDPYTLYSNALDYVSAKKDKDNTELDLRGAVDDGFDNYAAARTEYKKAVKTLTSAKNALLTAEVLNALGELNDSEYNDIEEAYNTANSEVESTLTNYSSITYEFDKTTCGGVSAYLEMQGITLGSSDTAAANGLKTLVPVYEDGIIYSLDFMAEESLFDLRIDVPSDFSVENINYYELWCNNIQVGPRTYIKNPIRHLSIALEGTDKCEVRFYKNATGQTAQDYIATSEFDPTVYRGQLAFIKDYNTFTQEGMVIGSYEVNNEAKTGSIKLKLKLDNTYGVAKYGIKVGNIYSENGDLSADDSKKSYLREGTASKFVDIDKEYTYLDAVGGGLANVTIEFTDADGNKLFDAIMKVGDGTVVVPRSQLEYIMNYQG